MSVEWGVAILTETIQRDAKTPLIRPDSYGFLYKVLFAVFVVFLPPLLASKPGLFGDGDVSWHVAAGRWILENHAVPSTDPFSFTMAGQPWIAHEWLSEIIYASAFDFAGFAGLAAVVALAITALHWIVFTHLRTRVGPAAMLLSLIALDLVLARFMLARPHVLIWPLLALWTSLLLSYRDRGQVPPLWLALLVSVWTNFHGSFPIAWIVAASIALDALISARWSRPVLLGWLAFGIASVLAALLNANGLTQFLLPLTIMGMESVSVLGEWMPSTPSTSPLLYAVLLCTLAGLMVRGVKLKVGETLLLLFLLGWTFSQVRHQTWLAVVAALILAPRFAAMTEDVKLFHDARSRQLWLGGALAVSISLLLLRLWIPLEPAYSRTTPKKLIAHVPAELRTKPVFNAYGFGGPLILAGIKPYIDGRADMYGDTFVLDFVDMTDGDTVKFEAAVRKYDIQWTMLQPNQGLVKRLDASPHWRRIYADEIGVIHLRTM
jgi:hypothetical protein